MSDFKQPAESHDPLFSFTGLYLRNLGAHLLSFAAVFILNISTPLAFFKLRQGLIFSQKGLIFRQGGWVVFLVFYLLIILLVLFLQSRIQRPVAEALAVINKNRTPHKGLMEKAKRRILNMPFIIMFINLGTFILLPLIYLSLLNLFIHVSMHTNLFLFFRAFMLGLIAGTLSFFLIEDYSRRKLVPLLFPEGRLTSVPGVIKISISRRIRLLTGAGTLNPMILLIVTLIFITWETDEIMISSRELSKDILLFTVLLCGIFIIIAFRLNYLVGGSILKPIYNMLDVIEKIKDNRLDQQIKVISNDEIGMLGDTGNDMIKGLADRERIRDEFGKYATPEIRDRILNGQIPLDGEKALATLLFSDLRNYTSYVEQNPPEEVIRSTRAYFTAMQKAISLHGGLVLQYVGDEIEAVFGVPIRQTDHADKAVLAAIEMRESLAKLNAHRIQSGKPLFQHGVGICTGSVLAGLTGSEDRLSYTLIGNTVNVASRIQGLTKVFHCDILIAEDTVDRLYSTFKMEKETPQHVKGYSKPITVFKLLDK
jgi:class 3 adenylate cyclase